MKTGLVYDPAYLNHDTGRFPERADRVSYSYSALADAGMLERVVDIKPRPATVEEIRLVHEQEYINRIRDFSDRGGGVLTFDSAGSSATFDTALLAAGGVLTALDAVMDKKIETAFALVRPPGHHALPGKSMGFCFFNNLAICARYAAKKYDLDRILIIDWDEHHGNGIEDAFYAEDSVLYFSVHRYGSFPDTGAARFVGEGRGEGYNINVPLPRKSNDDDYEYAFQQILLPVADAYKPELVLVAAGMDAHARDPIGQMKMSGTGFGRLAAAVLEIAGRYCNGTSIFVLEGGYNPKALADGVLAIVNTLVDWDIKKVRPASKELPPARRAVRKVVDGVKQMHRRYWPFL
ncbi:MAG: histone deacetylase [Peptococcaceae bacterium]|nr:histone deacetylase [Candidatus Syntrophopropionicum ammoniitolerans]